MPPTVASLFSCSKLVPTWRLGTPCLSCLECSSSTSPHRAPFKHPLFRDGVLATFPTKTLPRGALCHGVLLPFLHSPSQRLGLLLYALPWDLLPLPTRTGYVTGVESPALCPSAAPRLDRSQLHCGLTVRALTKEQRNWSKFHLPRLLRPNKETAFPKVTIQIKDSPGVQAAQHPVRGVPAPTSQRGHIDSWRLQQLTGQESLHQDIPPLARLLGHQDTAPKGLLSLSFTRPSISLRGGKRARERGPCWGWASGHIWN